MRLVLFRADPPEITRARVWVTACVVMRVTWSPEAHRAVRVGRFAAGEVSGSTRVWKEGMGDWTELAVAGWEGFDGAQPSEELIHYHHEGVKQPAVTLSKLQELWTDKRIHEGTSVWKDGMADWTPLGATGHGVGAAFHVRSYAAHPTSCLHDACFLIWIVEVRISPCFSIL